MSQRRSMRTAVLVFTLPTLLLFTIVVIYPTVRTLMMSTFDWDGITPGVFTGLKNFTKLVNDPLFWVSVRNGLIFAVVMTIYQLGLGTFFALALANRMIRGRRFVRKVYFIPVVLSVTVVSQLWLSIYNPEFGLINKLFGVFGLSYRQDWLSSMGLSSILAIAFVSSWQGLGYQMTLLYAGAKSVPAEILEAARVDGATTFQSSWRIMIPLMAETYRICLIFTVTAGLNAFSYMQIMTKGGPGTATYTLTYMMYRSAFQVDQYGYGCAAAVVLVLFCLAATLTINRFVARERVTY